MLSASSFDKSVDGIIGILGTWLYAHVSEKYSLLSIVTYFGNVADWVVGVMQVLHLAARPAIRGRLLAILRKGIGIAQSQQMYKAEGLLVVVVKSDGSVFVIDPLALTL